ncbi:potassium channel family protein [Halorussus gelatinilyticus]|uniref:Potassium channel family protein n=1 Tax=Halorussus gelatinilyticus TaxID=2937524 RepID=A0A8U0IIF5_9EURY|nr:potassium channel family protein [Halorussus gelatinilyticus]UPW00052.1 potassium channel family protein [Halorussus gelatinilyticus]
MVALTSPVSAVSVAANQVSPAPLQLAGDLQLFYLVVGVTLAVAGAVDLLWTTLWIDGGAGPLTTPLMVWTWRGLQSLRRGQSRLLSLSGPLILAMTLTMWVVLLWAGWTFIFASGTNALNYTRGAEPVSWIGRIYFVAYTMFTMGNGDFSPTSGVWQIVTALANGSGMILITLSVTYLINVLQAVVNARSFASSVQGIAECSEAFVRTGWDGENFDEHAIPLDTFASKLSTVAAQHKAFPILHYYRSSRRQQATPMAVGVFDDALTMLRFGVDPEHRPNEPLLETGRSSVQSYLQSVYSLPIRPSDRPPSAPNLDVVREEGVPTVSDEEFDGRLADLSDRRRRVLGIVESQAWQWPSQREP